MNRAAQVIPFILVSTLIVAGYHRYLWVRLVRDPGLPPHWRSGLTLAFVVLAVITPVSFAVFRYAPRDAVRPVAWAVYIWVGLSFLLFVTLLGSELARLVLIATGNAGGPADPARRLTIARVIAAAASLVASGAAAFAMSEALGAVRVVRVRVPLARLPASMVGTTIAQISDIHIGPTLGHDFLAGIVARVNGLSPDLIAITGDLVDGSVTQLGVHVAPLADLKARYGAYFVTGNHEYYSGVEEWLVELARLGVRVLRNERVTIGEGDSFDLAGVDDWSSRGHAEGHGHDLPRAVADRDPARELILLAHQPRSAPQAADAGVGLQLSGHTHGGQIAPWNFLVRLQQPFVAGLYRLRDTWVYVSRGTGFWGPPMRLGAPPEITLFELVRP